MSDTAEARSRLTMRIPDRMRETLEQAAELVGSTVNQFMVQSAYEKAQQIIERETVIRLSQEAARKVFELMENPPKANERLLAAMKSSKERIRV